jgi:hypothetical protein
VSLSWTRRRRFWAADSDHHLALQLQLFLHDACSDDHADLS